MEIAADIELPASTPTTKIQSTFSKSIDDVSSFNGPGGTIVQFIDNLSLERGRSNFAGPHNLSTTFQYTSPVGMRGRFRNTKWYTTWMRGWATISTVRR